jgi:endonuclease III
VNRDQVFEFFRRLAEANPSPTTELEYTNPYTLLVAVVLSAQATDVSVNIACRPIFEHISTPEQMVEFGEERLRDAIKTIGLFNTKAKNVIALSEALIRDHAGEVPRTREELEKLPGVGRKTANVVLNTAFRSGNLRGRHAHLSCGQPHRPRPGQGSAPSRTEARENCAAALSPRRASLAYPARPLHVQGAPAGMLAMPGDRSLSLQAENAAARRAGEG